MAAFSYFAFTAAFITLGVALLAYLWATVGQQKRAARVATVFSYNSAALLTASLGSRWIAAGHAPYSNQFEFATSFAWGTLATYLYLEFKYRLKSLGAITIAIAFGLLVYASTLPARIDPLIAALQNNILILHVGSAVISYGAFACAFAAGLLYLLNRNDRVAWLPAREVLDEIGYKAIIIGFPAQAMLLILGAVWAYTAWGRYWGWDPKETAALVTWLIAAFYLHARAQRGWHGTRSAVVLMVLFGAVVFTFSGNLFLGGLHAYSGL
ncbi:MAG TPA: c-type cytochrome biogenesis protein CcsB [Chloroflexota bacterium]|nr:c-type cytochrome biogenesis protein CcsB [Chloroflexota bacterium]